MLSALVTVLLFSIILLIAASLIITARRERRHSRTQVSCTPLSTYLLAAHPLDRHATIVLQMHDGMVVGSEKPVSPILTSSPSWYTRHRTLVSLGFLLMLVLTFFIQGELAGGTLQDLTKGLSILGLPQTTGVQTNVHLTASQQLIRGDSAARNQYHTAYQLQVWSYSSCSGFAIAEVMDAYGRHLIAADVLEVEQSLGVWSVYSGLLRDTGIATTANYFGFNASLSTSRTLQDIIAIGNNGAPVIASVRDSYYYPGGHIFVVRGGDSQYVYLADSSPANFTRMSYPMFLNMWQARSFSAVLTPR